jgi:3-oxoacyl-[acyl-carrier-protein] synthase-3
MDGRAVFKWAVRLLNDTIHDVLDFAHLGVADVDLVILHQANIRIIEASVADLGVDRARVCVNIDRFGNTSAGSIPLALNEAVQMGRVKRGNRLLLAGFGAGLAWGTALLRW